MKATVLSLACKLRTSRYPRFDYINLYHIVETFVTLIAKSMGYAFSFEINNVAGLTS